LVTLRDLPFRHQLALVVTLTSGLAVGLAGLGTLWYERREAYLQIQDDYLPLAQIIGSNCEGALSFGDVKAAEATLKALALKPQVVSARLYTAAGRPFATYRRSGAESDAPPEAPGTAGPRFEGRYFLIDHPINYDHEPVGSLYLKIDTTAATARLWRAALILSLVFLASGGVALLVSARLQARVSAPIVDLAIGLRTVSEHRDYTVRVTPAGPIELRGLADAFNEMLSQIQERDGALRAARDELEVRVEDRGRDLQREVGERRKAVVGRRAAEVQNNLLNQAISSSSEMISITGLDGRFIFVNQAFLDTYGYSRAETVGQNISLIDSSANPPNLRDVIWKASQHTGWRGEVLNRRRQGGDFPIDLSTSVVRDDDGQPVGLLGVARDITEVRLREERLRLQSAALESTADAVAITERDGTITWVNPAFTTLTGFEADEAIGQKTSLLRSGQHDETFYRELWKTVLGGQVWDGELTNKRKDGQVYLEAQTITPVRDAQGEISHFVAVKRDISGRRRLEEQLRQAQKMEAVGRLSGGIAHDFNNLLNVILGFGEMLLRHLPADDERLRRYAQQVMKAGNRGAGLTRQLLAFSRQQVLQPTVVDLNTVITEAQKMLGRLLGEDLEVVLSLAPDLGRVEVDVGQIEQVIMNLAVNARDAMPQGGTLAIETANFELLASAAAQYRYPVMPGPYARLIVSDNGGGMDAATRAHIFEPFFTTKEAGKGTGLGLATVYGIVKQSKGYIWVDSEVGEGSRFTILLPRLPVETAVSPAEPPDLAEPKGAETILLVEDDDDARSLWQETLEALGYRVLTASNGAAALELAVAHRERIDLLLTDVVMPLSGGRELALRLTEARPGLRVIFMSGYTADTMLRQGIEDGGPFLQKPFTAQQLAKKIRETLEGAVPAL
jgi:two-component system, cell cycle sensor histidine kinase and response regulator CckA